MTAPDPEEIQTEIRTAQDFLREAEGALEHDLLRAATSQSYYAMLHAVWAVLAGRGLSAKTHKGTIRLFGEHLVQSGDVSRDYGKMFTDAHDERQLADYHAMTGSFDKADVARLVENARMFVEKMESLL